MNTKKRSKRLQKTTPTVACIFAALLVLVCLGGCVAQKTPSETESNAMSQANDVAEQERGESLADSMDSADLSGDVIDFDSTGFTLRPTQGDEETAMKPLQDVGTDRTIICAANVEVSNVYHNRNTGTSEETSATVSDIKIDSSVYVWLNNAGEARKIILFHLS